MKQPIFILFSVPALDNASSVRSEKHELLGVSEIHCRIVYSMNGRHPWLARCQDETRDSVNTTLKRAHYRHSDKGIND